MHYIQFNYEKIDAYKVVHTNNPIQNYHKIL